MGALKCSDCGAENEPQASGWSYCVRCGKRLSATTAPAAAASTSVVTSRGNPPNDRWANFADRSESHPAAPFSSGEIAPPAARFATHSTSETPVGGRRKTTVTLRGRNEWVTDSLPSACMCCGSAATTTKEKKFGWYPAWVWLLLPFGYIPFLVVLIVMRKMMSIKIPLCDRHRRPWLPQQLLAALLLVYLLVLPWFLIYLGVVAERNLGPGNPWGLALLLGWVVGIPLLFVVLFIARRVTIHAKQITVDSMTLGGVSEAFARTLHDPARRW